MPPIRNVIKQSVIKFRLSLLCHLLALGMILAVEADAAKQGAFVLFDGMTWAALLVLAGLALNLWNRQETVSGIERGSRLSDTRLADLKRDALTGALARRFFVDELKEAMRFNQRKATEKARPVALVLIDLDHFKTLNDSFGHNVGDYALTHLVEIIGKVLPKATIGRLGGDEFAVMVTGEEAADSMAAAQRLLTLLRQPAATGGRQIHLSASIGIARSPEHTLFAEELILLADLALYESKRMGRSRATLFDRQLLKEEQHRRFIERELRAAILLEHLELHYQPVVDLDGKCFGVEALVRWRHPTLGFIPPSDFIPIAEETTLIDLLGEWVFRRACQDLPRLPGERLAFNVSAAQLQRDDLIEMIDRVLKETGRPAERFTMEITENLALGAGREVMARIETLRRMGLRVALDDFGTGHCNFNYLRTLPVDTIKIDRSYIASLSSDPVAGVFVTATAETGRILDLAILAEGVETEEQFTMARAAGCTRFQGYYFARPQPLSAFLPESETALALAS